jgi:hypothetical protein
MKLYVLHSLLRSSRIRSNVPYTRSITDNLLLDFSHLETHFSAAFLTHLSVSPHSCFRCLFVTNSATVQKCAREIIIRDCRLIKITYYRMVICNCYKDTDTTITSIRMHNAYVSSISKASTLQMDVTGFSETSVYFMKHIFTSLRMVVFKLRLVFLARNNRIGPKHSGTMLPTSTH